MTDNPFHRPIVHHGDCLAVLRTLPDESIDAVVTDPPYGLSNTDPKHVAETLIKWVTGDHEYTPPAKGGFMGKTWDSFVPPPAVWDECMRVLKPGGHLLVFAGTRTQDLMGLSIRLAGFDIRDGIGWIYGSGFPKSMDVSKAIDKVNGEGGRLHKFTAYMRTTGLTSRQLDEATGTSMGGHYLTAASQPAIPTPTLWAKIRPMCGDVPAWVDELVDRIEAEREVTQEGVGVHRPGDTIKFDQRSSTDRERRDNPATPEAERWAGWGTALKPAIEPVIVARKPIKGTVAANVLAHGTGALNIDATRIPTDDALGRGAGGWQPDGYVGGTSQKYDNAANVRPEGRWPANVLLDPEAAAAMDAQSGYQKDGVAVQRNGGGQAIFGGIGNGENTTGARKDQTYGGGGGASRFFPVFKYQAKAPAKERPQYTAEEGRVVKHATVKPLELMRWLVRLVTPAGGVVLDPFAGSGTTGEAAILEGFDSILIEGEAEHLPLIDVRINRSAPAVEDDLFARIRATTTRDELAALYDEDPTVWTDEHTAAGTAHLERIER